MNRLTACAPKSKDGINRLRRFFLKLNLANPAIAGHHACQIFRKNLSDVAENLGILVVIGISSADKYIHNKLALVALSSSSATCRGSYV